ncbi:hypothetical protein P167DRAFT_211443 [Morchella conica CCBAS932]|uniref:Uncharacterized protein n=1 Tax=Morchella conica CCBAS932 TaxID=1392247 RepID=A0A3N4KQA4_9PEZI|nr:hypothetical protein P167DRAFT_211443 [Morchella conica CCBAS932]
MQPAGCLHTVSLDVALPVQYSALLLSSLQLQQYMYQLGLHVYIVPGRSNGLRPSLLSLTTPFSTPPRLDEVRGHHTSTDFTLASFSQSRSQLYILGLSLTGDGQNLRKLGLLSAYEANFFSSSLSCWAETTRYLHLLCGLLFFYEALTKHFLTPAQPHGEEFPADITLPSAWDPDLSRAVRRILPFCCSLLSFFLLSTCSEGGFSCRLPCKRTCGW